MTPEKDFDPTDHTAIYDELMKALASNGDLTVQQHRRLVLMAFASLFDITLPMVKQVDQLKRKNILLWVEAHPRITSVIVTGVVLFAMFVHQISPWVIDHLGLLVGWKLP